MLKVSINNTPFWERIQPRDIIALIVLTFCFVLLFLGRDGTVAAITSMIVGYYFSKRVYEEKNNK